MYEKIGKLVVTLGCLYVGYYVTKYVAKKGIRAIDNQIDDTIDKYTKPKKDKTKNCMEHEEVSGQALSSDDEILTPTGWKTVGDITTEDTVATGDGSFTKVAGVYSQGIQKNDDKVVE